MKKIQFENKPSTKTPVSASNLNLLQDNVEEAINIIEENIENEVILFEGNLLGGQTKSIDFSQYKRLFITYSMYDHPNETTNNAGTSGIAVLDLTSNINQMYSVCGQLPYNMFSSTSASDEMGYAFRVNKTKTEFYCRFHYKGNFQDNNQYYYVSKIVGIK